MYFFKLCISVCKMIFFFALLPFFSWNRSCENVKLDTLTTTTPAASHCITSLLLSANENDLALEANEKKKKMISLLVAEDKQHVFEILNRPIIGLSKKRCLQMLLLPFRY